MGPREVIVMLGAAACGGGGGDDAPPASRPPPPAIAGAQTTLVELANARGEPLFAVLAEPTAPGPHPAVVVFHGSGGLFRLPAPTDPGTCSPELESQFARWAERLVGLGFTVMLPDSFTPRGYCDEHDDPRRDQAFPPIDADPDGKTRRLIARIYDADTALRSLVAMPNVRADAVALLGFSNGASTTAVYTHHRLSDALAELAADPDGQALGVEFPPLPGPIPPLRAAIAYYPGCGFDGVLPFTTDPSNLERFFYPATPLRIEHAALDPLLDHCSITQTGTRERQADGYATALRVDDRYDIAIHAGADHGFDQADCESAGDGASADALACRDALATTLDLLEPLR